MDDIQEWTLELCSVQEIFFLIDDQKVVMMSLKICAIEHCCSEVAELILCDYGNCGTSMIT